MNPFKILFILSIEDTINSTVYHDEDFWTVYSPQLLYYEILQIVKLNQSAKRDSLTRFCWTANDFDE